MKKIAVILSGCGLFDGAEIHEATLTLLAIAQNGAAYEIFAPDIDQYHVINHLTGQPMNEKRNVLVESARIARGNIKPLDQFRESDFDALVIPGGYGAAKNLSTVGIDGADARVNPDVERAVKSIHAAGKPIGALCVAPAMIVRILGNVRVTIGDDPDTISVIEEMGGTHIVTTHGQVVVDKENKVFSTPCYMLDATIEQIYDEADKVVKAVMLSA